MAASWSEVRRSPPSRWLSDYKADYVIGRIAQLAGLKPSGWHKLRHSFGTHAALFGVNPWRLQAWMGHKRIDETLRYVHVAEAHERTMPEPLVAAGRGETDPDRRVLAMLAARGDLFDHEAIWAPGGQQLLKHDAGAQPKAPLMQQTSALYVRLRR